MCHQCPRVYIKDRCAIQSRGKMGRGVVGRGGEREGERESERERERRGMRKVVGFYLAYCLHM